MTIKSQLLGIAAFALIFGACSSNEEKQAVVVEEQLPIVKIEPIFLQNAPTLKLYQNFRLLTGKSRDFDTKSRLFPMKFMPNGKSEIIGL